MEITYIGNSGFLVHAGGVYLLFDYYTGIIPAPPAGSRLYVFVSHRHEDHFNPVIFELAERYDVTFFLSYDIRLDAFHMRKYRIPQNLLEKIISVRYDDDKKTDGLRVRAFKSADVGVAYLVNVAGWVIYHAGDHNWWHWMGETKQYNNNMAANYKKGIAQLIQAEKQVDIAFVPLDPRLAESYYYGMKYFLDNVNCSRVFPMHFSGDYQCRNRFTDTYGYEERLLFIEQEGQVFNPEAYEGQG